MHTKKTSKILFIFCYYLAFGCAGPATPFGAIDELDPTKKEALHGEYELLRDRSVEEPQNPADDLEKQINRTLVHNRKFHFQPARQNLHDRSDFVIRIVSDTKITEDYLFKIYYNGLDLTQKFLASLDEKTIENNNLVMRYKGLKLSPSMDHKIQVFFKAIPTAAIKTQEYRPPKCPWRAQKEIKSLGKFHPPNEYRRMITRYAKRVNINPNLIAGLIAVESGFNKNAVSWAKAVGLTQIATLAEKEILKKGLDWPRNNIIQKYPVLMIRGMISRGIINNNNEWRLEPKYSIQGGILYLNHLMWYWNRPENRRLLRKNSLEKDFIRMVLASYHSGAARVKLSLKLLGKDWLHRSNLTTARKYVNCLISYCYHFSKKDPRL